MKMKQTLKYPLKNRYSKLFTLESETQQHQQHGKVRHIFSQIKCVKKYWLAHYIPFQLISTLLLRNAT